jgi:transcriptional regulator EpsA
MSITSTDGFPLSQPGALGSLDGPGGFAIEALSLSPVQAQALLRLVESAPDVRRRGHFFLWMQSHLQPLLPHVLAVCGAYDRQRRQLLFEAFNTVTLSQQVLASLSGVEPPFVAALAARWIEQRGVPYALDLRSERARGLGPHAELLSEAGATMLVVHGVSRPDRLHELESLFVLGGPSVQPTAPLLHGLELLLPHLHSTWLRACATERDLAGQPGLRPPTPTIGRRGAQPRLTPRERQILHWVREGMSNQQIGQVLDISALTVKNHVQKILRKLGAANRAQAVAMTMQDQAPSLGSEALGDDPAG